MVPTRELAKQVSDVFESISDRLNVACFYGGTPYEKQSELSYFMIIITDYYTGNCDRPFC